MKSSASELGLRIKKIISYIQDHTDAGSLMTEQSLKCRLHYRNLENFNILKIAS